MYDEDKKEGDYAKCPKCGRKLEILFNVAKCPYCDKPKEDPKEEEQFKDTYTRGGI